MRYTKKELNTRGWPKDGSPLHYQDIAAPIRKALKEAYQLDRHNEDLDIAWDGPDNGLDEAATCLSISEQLKAHNLKISLEDQGRDALDEIISIAVRLGIEQGRRLKHQRDQMTFEIMSLRLKNSQKEILDIQQEIESRFTEKK